jgi:hypothetical protein
MHLVHEDHVEAGETRIPFQDAQQHSDGAYKQCIAACRLARLAAHCVSDSSVPNRLAAFGRDAFCDAHGRDPARLREGDAYRLLRARSVL